MPLRLPAPVLFCLLLSALLNGLLAGAVRGQAPRIVRTLGVADGLAHRAVHCFYQDRAGFLWIGTENGLDRYDGYELRSFARLSGHTLPNPTVWAVTEDAAGRLLLGTTGGLYAYDRARHTLREVALGAGGAAHVSVTALALAPDGAVWVGTQYGEVFRLPPAPSAAPVVHCTLSSAAAGRLTRTVLGVYPQRDGGALVETYSGVVTALTADGRERQVIAVPGQLLRLVRAEAGGGWLLASRQGVFRVAPDPDTPPRRVVTLPRAATWTEAMFSAGGDRWGNVWFGTGPDEIQRLDPASLRLDSVGAAVRSLFGGPFRVHCFYEDRGGSIWVGTNQGVVQLDNQRPRFATLIPPLRQWVPGSQFSTRGMVETADGSLYVGSYAGFFRRDPAGTWQRLRWQRNGTDYETTAYALWADPATGDIWIAGEGAGLVRYEPAHNRFTPSEQEDDPSAGGRGHHATCLLPDARGRFWVGSYTDLRLYDRTTGRRLAILDQPARWLGVPELRYRALVAAPGSAGDVWAATELGLFQLDANGRVRRHWGASRDGLPVNDVLCVWPEPAGRYVWVGTRGGGLGRLDVRTNRWRIWRQTDGLPDDLVCAVLPEADSALWLATQRGLARLSWRTGQFRSFFARDGLADDEFNHGSALRRRDGRFLFGGVAGLSEVPPDPAPDDAPAAAAAPLLLTGLSTYDGQLRELTPPAPGAAPLTLPAEGGFLSVQFALVDFRETGQHQYAYQLGGRMAPWLSLGAERTLRLAGLPAGRDTLRIRGAGPDGRWSRHELRLPLRVMAPLWRRGWFLAAVALALAGLLYGLYRLRIGQLMGIERAASLPG